MLSKKTVAIYFHTMKKEKKNKITMKVNSYCLVTKILQNILFSIQQKKETHTGVEQHESE